MVHLNFGVKETEPDAKCTFRRLLLLLLARHVDMKRENRILMEDVGITIDAVREVSIIV